MSTAETPTPKTKVPHYICKCGALTTNAPCKVCGAVLCPRCKGPAEGADPKPFVNSNGMTYSGCPSCAGEPMLREVCAVCGKPVTAGKTEPCKACGRPICAKCAKARKPHADSTLRCPACVEALHTTLRGWLATVSGPIPPNTDTQTFCASCGKPLTDSDKGSAGNTFNCVVCHSVVCKACRTEPASGGKPKNGFETSCRACRTAKLA